MAKIILTKGRKVLQEIHLVKESTNIGRCPHNDLVIEDAAISAERMVIHTTVNEPVLEDLSSTNGTLVNGQPIKKHFLQDRDVIELAQYRFQFLVEPYAHEDCLDSGRGCAPNDNGLDRLLNHTYPKIWCSTENLNVKRRSVCAIKLLDGVNAGKEIDLAKPVTTLGKFGMQVAAIAQYLQGYGLSHVEGEIYSKINGRSIGTDAFCMSHGDIIDLAGRS